MHLIELLLDDVNDGSVMSHPVAGGPNGIAAATSMKPRLRLVRFGHEARPVAPGNGDGRWFKVSADTKLQLPPR